MENTPPINSVFANVYVSYYRTFADTQPADVSLLTLLSTVNHRAKIIALRAIQDEIEQRAAKEELPGFTVSARMKKGVAKSEAAIYRHSGFLCIDIDRKHNKDVPNFFELKEEFKKLPFVACCKASCRGQGYFLVIPVEDPEKHEFYFNWLTLFFNDAGLKIDTSTSNPCAFRFVSWDENTYFNHFAERLKHYIEPPKAEVKEFVGTVNADWERANVEYCIKQICSLKIDVTATLLTWNEKEIQGYTTWFYIGCCFAGTYGSEGKDYFHHVSQYYPKYDETETNRQFQKCLQWKELKPGMKTFYDACKVFNILYKHRPGYVPPGLEQTDETDTETVKEVTEPETKAVLQDVPDSQNLTKPYILPPLIDNETNNGCFEMFTNADICQPVFSTNDNKTLPENFTKLHILDPVLQGPANNSEPENLKKPEFSYTINTPANDTPPPAPPGTAPPGEHAAGLAAFENWLTLNPAGGVFEFEGKRYKVTHK